MKRITIALDRVFTATCCCGVKIESNSSYSLWVNLLEHVKSKHNILYKRLAKLGKVKAHCMIGCGYGRDRDWETSRPEFKEHYTGKALEDYIFGRIK